MKIILCSENDVIRERWRSLLCDHGYRLYQAAMVEGLKQIVRADETYLFLVHQPFADLVTIQEICGASDMCKILILADSPSETEGLSLLIQGVSGYVNTYISGGQLLEAVQTIIDGRVWYSQNLMNRLIQSLKVSSPDTEEKPKRNLPESLSEREKEIALLVSEGLSNNSIAEKLYISERTVKSHLSTIYNKTGVRSRLQLALSINR